MCAADDSQKNKVALEKLSAGQEEVESSLQARLLEALNSEVIREELLSWIPQDAQHGSMQIGEDPVGLRDAKRASSTALKCPKTQ